MESNEFMMLMNQINDLKAENAELEKKVSEHTNSIILLLLLVIILGSCPYVYGLHDVC